MPEDLKDLQRGLIGAEPLMVIGNAVAGAGQDVQDAWEYVQSHLTGGKMPSMPSFSVPSFSMPASAQAAPAQAAKPSIDYDKLAAQHGGQPEVNVTMTSKPGEQPPSDIEFEQMAKQFGGAPEDPTGGAGQPVQYDTPLDFAKGLGSSLLGAVNPAPLVQMAAHPIEAVKSIGAAQGAVYDKARASFDKGDYGTAARHFVDFLLPIVGPQLDQMADKLSSGQPWRGSGEAVGLGLQLFGPAALAKMAVKVPGVAKNPNVLEAAAVKFGQDHGIPIDAATATGNKAIGDAQFLVDRSIAGSLRSTGRAERVGQALERVGGELAQKTGGKSVTPEQGGATIGDALAAKAKAMGGQQDVNYARVRELQQAPEHQLDVPMSSAAVDTLDPNLVGQLRRIVHEMEAAPATKYQLESVEEGGTTRQRVEGTGGEGAKVFHDITQLSGSTLPRWKVQAQLEEYLAGGPESENVKAAIDVAKQRSAGKGGYTVSKPELPPSEMDTPTRLEAGRQRFQTMGLPVSLAEVKDALRPFVAELDRQMPETQQKANPGLRAMRNIIDGPDWAPLSQADRDLSTIKAIAREKGGLAKIAASKLEAAVQTAVGNASPEVRQALEKGRTATKAKYAALDVLKRVTGKNEEPVQAFRNLTANGDSHVNLLRAVRGQAPEAIKEIARSKLEDILKTGYGEKPTAKAARMKADWERLGPQTKQILYPGLVDDLDKFFLLAKRIAVNPNPPNTAGVLSLLGQVETIHYDPVWGGVAQLGAAGLSELLHSKAGVKLLTNGLTLAAGNAPKAAQAAAAARILATAREMGLPVSQGASATAPERAGAAGAGPDKTSVPPSPPSRPQSIQVGPYRVEPQ